MGPKPLEIIKLAHRLIKDMNDHIGKIYQYPMAAGEPLDGERRDPHVAKIFVKTPCDALNLPVGTTGADDEVVADRSDVANL